MLKILSLSQKDTEKLLDMPTVVEKVIEAYRLKFEKTASLFPMIFHEFEPGVADMDIKSGQLQGANVFGHKLVSWFSENPQKGLPTLIGTVMVYDSSTGAPKAILSAEHITSMRTGAAGAIGAKFLARPDSKTLLMVGTGHQALFQIAATLMTFPEINKVLLYNPRSQERAQEFKNVVESKLNQYFLSFYEKDSKEYTQYKNAFTVEFEVVTEIEKQTGEADIIITATPARSPLIKNEWVNPGTHFSCIGADISGKQEIDENILKRAWVFTDDLSQSINVGECEMAIKKGAITPEHILGEIGAVITGNIKGRDSADDITVFDSTGIALQDLIVADYATKLATTKNIGTTFSL
jgi:ornithine cyclodeaminase/alanine dehydrogenase